MKKFFPVVALLALLLSGCGKTDMAQDSSDAPAGYSTYTSDGPPFSILYPQDWAYFGKGETGTTMATFVSPKDGEGDNFQENLAVEFGIFEDPPSLDEWTEFYLNTGRKELTNFQILSTEKITIGGVPAVRTIFSGELEGLADELTGFQVDLVQTDSEGEDIFNSLQFLGLTKDFSTFRPTVEIMANSYRFMD